jgi:hypothetical protein
LTLFVIAPALCGPTAEVTDRSNELMGRGFYDRFRWGSRICSAREGISLILGVP